MNRRDALLGIGSLGVAGATIKEIPADPEPICFVVNAECKLTGLQIQLMRDEVQRRFKGTKYEHTPVFVCQQGIDFDVVRRPVDA